MNNGFKLFSIHEKPYHCLNFLLLCCPIIKKLKFLCGTKNVVMNVVEEDWTHYIWWLICLSFKVYILALFVLMSYRKNIYPKLSQVKYIVRQVYVARVNFACNQISMKWCFCLCYSWQVFQFIVKFLGSSLCTFSSVVAFCLLFWHNAESLIFMTKIMHLLHRSVWGCPKAYSKCSLK